MDSCAAFTKVTFAQVHFLFDALSNKALQLTARQRASQVTSFLQLEC